MITKEEVKKAQSDWASGIVGFLYGGILYGFICIIQKIIVALKN